MRDALFIARKDLRHMLRARETLLWTFFMPIVFFYFIGTITGGFGGGGGGGRESLALSVPPDAGFLGDQVARRLEEQDLNVVRAKDPEELARYSRRLVLPPGFTDSVVAGRRVTVTFAHDGEGPRADYDRLRVGRALYTVLADLIVGREQGGTPGPELFDKVDAIPRALRLEVAPAGKRREAPSGFTQTIPGTTVMFTILVLLTSGAVLLVTERREGLLRRLASAPISRGSVVLGKWMARMALGLVQIGFALASGTLLFRMRWGPDFGMVLLVLFVYASLNASLGLLLGSVAATEAQSVAIGVLTANLLAALGGCWWPIEITPPWMQTLSLGLPTGWAMGALHRLVSFEAGPASVMPHVAALAVTALLAGWGAVRLFRYE